MFRVKGFRAQDFGGFIEFMGLGPSWVSGCGRVDRGFEASRIQGCCHVGSEVDYVPPPFPPPPKEVGGLDSLEFGRSCASVLAWFDPD